MKRNLASLIVVALAGLLLATTASAQTQGGNDTHMVAHLKPSCTVFFADETGPLYVSACGYGFQDASINRIAPRALFYIDDGVMFQAADAYAYAPSTGYTSLAQQVCAPLGWFCSAAASYFFDDANSVTDNYGHAPTLSDSYGGTYLGLVSHAWFNVTHLSCGSHSVTLGLFSTSGAYVTSTLPFTIPCRP